MKIEQSERAFEGLDIRIEYFLEYESRIVFLIDVGFSCKKIKEMLSARCVDIESVRAVFITHEHCDHIQGLRGLRKYRNIKFFANRKTAEVLEEKFDFGINWEKFDTGDEVHFDGMTISSFNLPHDAVEPIGYVFMVDEDRRDDGVNSIAWMTDLGYIPSNAVKNIINVDLLVIESNYDNDMLTKDTKRPPYVKARIRSRYGHLPNELAINFVKNADGKKWKKVVFAHVSSDCNSESVIKEMIGKELPFELEIAKQ